MNPRARRLIAPFLVVLPGIAFAGDCDPARGEQLFAKCSTCHYLDDSGATLVGPNLRGIIERPIADVADFPYSEAMARAQGHWSLATLDRFLANPLADMPGTQMAFAGLRQAEDRRDLLCFLGR